MFFTLNEGVLLAPSPDCFQSDYEIDVFDNERNGFIITGNIQLGNLLSHDEFRRDCEYIRISETELRLSPNSATFIKLSLVRNQDHRLRYIFLTLVWDESLRAPSVAIWHAGTAIGQELACNLRAGSKEIQISDLAGRSL